MIMIMVGSAHILMTLFSTVFVLWYIWYRSPSHGYGSGSVIHSCGVNLALTIRKCKVVDLMIVCRCSICHHHIEFRIKCCIRKTR
jgi:hypothetical protein